MFINWQIVIAELFAITFNTSFLHHGRKYLRSIGIEPDPVGSGNDKTRTFGTYRTVGTTCPSNCLFLETRVCYAMSGNVGIHQKRSSNQLLSSLGSVALALVAAVKDSSKARLHVSGDFIKDGDIDNGGNIIDKDYIDGICEISAVIRQHLNQPNRVLAWTYTHIPQSTFNPFREQLKASGIQVLWSDSFGPNGAVVWSHETLDSLPDIQGAKPIPCPQQTEKSESCKQCDLCSRAEQLNLCIVFDGEGVAHNRAVAASMNKFA